MLLLVHGQTLVVVQLSKARARQPEENRSAYLSEQAQSGLQRPPPACHTAGPSPPCRVRLSRSRLRVPLSLLPLSFRRRLVCVRLLACPPSPYRIDLVAPAPVPVPAPAPAKKAASSSIATGDVAEGVALGALPWVVAPVVALAALRPLISKVRLSACLSRHTHVT